MKYSELHRLIQRNGWVVCRQNGSHAVYEKDGRKYTVPYHGAKEIQTPFAKSIIRDMRLK